MSAAASRAWSWRHAIAKSELPPTTRHVLLTMSLFMNDMGEGCYPSIEDLMEATGLSNRAIVTHLAQACEAHWLTRQSHGFRGQKWRRLEYIASWPGREIVADEGSEGGSLPSEEKVVNDVPEGGEPPASKVVNDVHRDKEHSTNHSKTNPVERERARGASEKAEPDPNALTIDAAWQALVKIWPDIALQSEPLARNALGALTGKERKIAVDRVPDFLALHREKQGKAKLPFLHNYLGEKHRWLDLPKSKPTINPNDLALAIVPPFDRAWWRLFWDGHRRRERRLIGDEARKAQSRIGWRIDPADREALEAAGKALVQIHVDGEAFAAWRKSLAKEGFDLPRPDVAKYIFVPSEFPPEPAESEDVSEMLGVD